MFLLPTKGFDSTVKKAETLINTLLVVLLLIYDLFRYYCPSTHIVTLFDMELSELAQTNENPCTQYGF